MELSHGALVMCLKALIYVNLIPAKNRDNGVYQKYEQKEDRVRCSLKKIWENLRCSFQECAFRNLNEMF